MKYVLLTDEQTCKDLSRALYRLQIPESLSEKTGTQYLFAWVKHPDQNEWALEFSETLQYRKHPDVNMMLTAPGDPYGSQAMMQTLFLPIAANGAASLQALLGYILANDVIDTAQVLPHVNPALVRTQAQMESAGWFA